MTGMLTRLLDIEEWSAEVAEMDTDRLDITTKQAAFDCAQRAQKSLEKVERKLLGYAP